MQAHNTVRLRRLAAFAWLLVLAPVAVPPATIRAAQETSVEASRREPQDPDGDEQISLGADLVTLDVSVVDKNNRPITNLPRDSFSVLEDGDAQSIEFFSKELAPVSLALVVDTSGSMRRRLDSVARSALDLVRAKRPDDEVAVITFRSDVNLLEEFTSNAEDIEDALADLDAKGQTSLLDALILSAEYVQREGRHRRKALVLVSDGVEKGSYYGLDDVIKYCRRLDVRLYLVGFTEDLETANGIFSKSEKEKASELLTDLARETGGKAFFPRQLKDLTQISDEIARDLRTVYALGYYPKNTRKDGRFRKIEVKVASDGQKLIARTRSGYQAASQ